MQPCQIHYVTQGMQRAILSFVLLSLLSGTVAGQVRKHYQLTNQDGQEEVHFTLKASYGSCKISPTNNANPISIYGVVNNDDLEPDFQIKKQGATSHVAMTVSGQSQETLMSDLGLNFFGGRVEQPEDRWKVFLSQSKPFHLNLHYGIGDANIDLSGIAVKNLNISTGSADVRVGYHSGFYNKIEMDTFAVKVDLGNITVDHMEQARARNVIADVGFGNCTLDFGNGIKDGSNVTAYVGAGNLIVLLPKTELPVKVVIQNSPLCHVQLTESFIKIADDTWVNHAYNAMADNITTFTLDVAMGQILFKEK